MARSNSFDGFVWYTMDTTLTVIFIMSTRSLECMQNIYVPVLN